MSLITRVVPPNTERPKASGVYAIVGRAEKSGWKRDRYGITRKRVVSGSPISIEARGATTDTCRAMLSAGRGGGVITRAGDSRYGAFLSDRGLLTDHTVYWPFS